MLTVPIVMPMVSEYPRNTQTRSNQSTDIVASSFESVAIPANSRMFFGHNEEGRSKKAPALPSFLCLIEFILIASRTAVAGGGLSNVVRFPKGAAVGDNVGLWR